MYSKSTDEARVRREIASHVSAVYRNIEGIDSLALGGTSARGNADRFSDIDIWMTYSKFPDLSLRKAALAELQNVDDVTFAAMLPGGLTLSESFTVSGIKVGIHPSPNSALDGVGRNLSDDIGTVSEITLAEFRHCTVMHDRLNLYGALSERLDAYPFEKVRHKVEGYLVKLITIASNWLPRAELRNDLVIAFFHRNSLIELTLKILFAVNGEYFPQMKDALWCVGYLENTPASIEVNIKQIAEGALAIGQSDVIEHTLIDVIQSTARRWSDVDVNGYIERLTTDRIRP